MTFKNCYFVNYMITKVSGISPTVGDEILLDDSHSADSVNVVPLRLVHTVHFFSDCHCSFYGNRKEWVCNIFICNLAVTHQIPLQIQGVNTSIDCCIIHFLRLKNTQSQSEKSAVSTNPYFS